MHSYQVEILTSLQSVMSFLEEDVPDNAIPYGLGSLR